VSYIPRTLEATLRRAALAFPAVEVTGPRQSGKTTLLKTVFADTHGFVSLDDADTRAHAVADPRSFLDEHPSPVIIDEFHLAPDLAGYIKTRIDADRQTKGAYLLTGSQNLTIAQTVSESLAGRVAVLQLFPLTQAEIRGEPDAPLFWERTGRPEEPPAASVTAAWEAFLRGYYPELIADPASDPALWHASYVTTYLQRDVRDLRHIGDQHAFVTFMSMLAARAGQVLDLSGFSRDLGIAVNTVKAWLSVLEATYQIIVLPAYFANIGKRLVKRPKVYFTDVGTLCHLVGVETVRQALAGPMAGPIVENAVVAEVYKSLAHRAERPNLHFWRTSAGAEVDLLVEHKGRLVPIEAKGAGTATRRMATGISRLRDDLGRDRTEPGFVVHPGQIAQPLGDGVIALPWAQV
jgi:uncharacterized protein